MPAPVVTDLPDPPLRTEDSATFSAKVEAFVAALVDFVPEINALGAYLQALESGTLSALLAAIDGAGSAANKLPYYTGSNAVALADLTSLARTILACTTAAAVRSAIGAGTGSGDLLASDNLSDVESVSTARGNLGAKASAPSVQSVTSSATVTPTFSDDMVKITAQAAGLTLANPTGTAVPGWGMAIRIKDNGTARSISYGTQYRAIGVTLPTTTVVNKTLYLGLIYNADDTKWDVIAVAQEA
jgi:hypothetical protein